MDLKNMRENGMRSLCARCLECHAERTLNMDAYPDYLSVKGFEPKMLCTSCGALGADVRPNWAEKDVQRP